MNEPQTTIKKMELEMRTNIQRELKTEKRDYMTAAQSERLFKMANAQVTDFLDKRAEVKAFEDYFDAYDHLMKITIKFYRKALSKNKMTKN